MALEIPTGTPTSFVRGDTVKWHVNEGDCPADTWTLTYYFVNEKGRETVVAADNGDGRWLVTIAADVSDNFHRGEYHYQAKISAAGEVSTIERGSVEVVHDFEGADTGHDARSQDEIILESVRAVIQRRATKDQQSMSIGGRSLSRFTWDELLELERTYAYRVKRKRDASRGVNSRMVQTRFPA